MSEVEAVIVNYATPDLTRMAVWSLRGTYVDLPITVVDNGSPDDSRSRLGRLKAETEPLELIEAPKNLHHGPAMDFAIRRSGATWILLFDSDCILYRPGLIEGMLERAAQGVYMIGEVVLVDDMGYGAQGGAHRYVHPKCALVRRSLYEELPAFEMHGVPCLRNELAAAERGHVLEDWPVRDYVYHLGRGTAGRHGYRLGFRGRLYQLLHFLRRA